MALTQRLGVFKTSCLKSLLSLAASPCTWTSASCVEPGMLFVSRVDIRGRDPDFPRRPLRSTTRSCSSVASAETTARLQRSQAQGRGDHGLGRPSNPLGLKFKGGKELSRFRGQAPRVPLVALQCFVREGETGFLPPEPQNKGGIHVISRVRGPVQ